MGKFGSITLWSLIKKEIKIMKDTMSLIITLGLCTVKIIWDTINEKLNK